VVAHPAPAALSGPARLRRGAGAALVAVLCALYARAFVLEFRTVASGSMAPALLPGDQVLIDRMLYAALPPALARLLPVRAPVAGDVVLARAPGQPRTRLLKRCAAVGGGRAGGTVVPAAHVYLLGDHGADSLDSRAFGPVPHRDLVGRAVLVLVSRERGGWRVSRTLRAVR
jgi:signal peptidase I